MGVWKQREGKRSSVNRLLRMTWPPRKRKNGEIEMEVVKSRMRVRLRGEVSEGERGSVWREWENAARGWGISFLTKKKGM